MPHPALAVAAALLFQATPDYPAPSIVRGTLVAMDTSGPAARATIRAEGRDGAPGETWTVEFPSAAGAGPADATGFRIGEQVSAAGFRAQSCDGGCRMRAGGLNYLSDGAAAFAGMRSSIAPPAPGGPAEAALAQARAAAQAAAAAPAEGEIIGRSALTNAVGRAPPN